MDASVGSKRRRNDAVPAAGSRDDEPEHAESGRVRSKQTCKGDEKPEISDDGDEYGPSIPGASAAAAPAAVKTAFTTECAPSAPVGEDDDDDDYGPKLPGAAGAATQNGQAAGAVTAPPPRPKKKRGAWGAASSNVADTSAGSADPLILYPCSVCVVFVVSRSSFCRVG